MIREKIKLVVNVNLNYVHYVLINEDDDIQTACFENDKQKGLAIITRFIVNFLKRRNNMHIEILRNLFMYMFCCGGWYWYVYSKN